MGRDAKAASPAFASNAIETYQHILREAQVANEERAVELLVGQLLQRLLEVGVAFFLGAEVGGGGRAFRDRLVDALLDGRAGFRIPSR